MIGMAQIKPLADVVARYAYDTSEYPDSIQMAMEDGSVKTYRLDVEQPEPHFLNAMELLKRLPVYGGYQYPETKKRRRRL